MKRPSSFYRRRVASGFRGVLLASAVCTVLFATGVGQASAAMSGLALNGPSVTTVNSSASYGASVVLAAAPLFGTADTLDSLAFTLPENTDLSGISTTSFTLSKGTVSSVDVVDNGTTQVLTVNLTGAVGAGFLGGNTTITISFSAPNPSVAGSYGDSNSFRVVANGTGGPLTVTRTFVLSGWATSPTVGAPSLADSTEWATTAMDVPVSVGPAGRLAANAAPGNVTTANSITVTFPGAYTLPVSPGASSITVGGTLLDAPPTVTGRAVTLRIPSGVTVANSGTAVVSFLPSFGLSNPDAGTYSVVATTDIQSGFGSSLPYIVTAVPTTLSVSSANQPAGSVVVRGQTRVVGGFEMQRNASSNPVTVSSITVEETGIAPASTVSGVHVYRDNGDGSCGAGDALLNAAPGSFTGANAAVTLAAPESVSQAVQQYWIVYTFADSASDGAIASARLSSVAHTADALSITCTAGAAFRVDAAPPVVSVTVPAADGLVVGGLLPPYDVAGVATDGVSGVNSVRLEIQRVSDSWYWNGLSWQEAPASIMPATSNGWLNWAYSWGITPAAQDGAETYTFRAFATDEAGSSAQAERTGIRFDNMAPTTSAGVVPVTPDGAAGWYRSVPSVTLASSEAGPTYYRWDGTPIVGDQSIYSGALAPSQGVHAIRYYSVDPHGNTETVGPGTTYKVDSVAPSAPTAAATALTSTSIEVSWSGAADSVSGIATYTVYEGATPVATTAGSSATVSVSAGTSHTYTVKASDVAGNASADSNAVTAGSGSAAPVTTLSAVPAVADGASGWYVTTPSITLSPDVPSTTSYRWDGSGGWATVSEPLAPAEGTHVLEYFSVSAEDATESVRTHTFKVDLSAPSTPGGAGVSGTTPTSLTLHWTASSDPVSGITNYDVVDTDLDTVVRTVTGTSATLTGLIPSTTYHVAIVARDGAGRVSSRSSMVSVTTLAAVVVNPGDNVSVIQGGVRVIFERVLVAGTLDIAPLAFDPHAPPAGFRLISTCNYDISTTSSHQGAVTVIMPYDPSAAGPDESQLRLFHWESGAWVDVTDSVDVANNEITGHTDGSLSPFGVGVPSAGTGAATPASSPWSSALLLAAGTGIAVVQSTHKKRMQSPRFDE